jgi:hypothetical protein
MVASTQRSLNDDRPWTRFWHGINHRQVVRAFVMSRPDKGSQNFAQWSCCVEYFADIIHENNPTYNKDDFRKACRKIALDKS